MRRRDFITAAIGMVATAWRISSHAESFPSRPITLIVPFAAGGPTDVLARILADHMRRTLGQTVVIENVTGASVRTAWPGTGRQPTTGSPTRPAGNLTKWPAC